MKKKSSLVMKFIKWYLIIQLLIFLVPAVLMHIPFLKYLIVVPFLHLMVPVFFGIKAKSAFLFFAFLWMVAFYAPAIYFGYKLFRRFFPGGGSSDWHQREYAGCVQPAIVKRFPNHGLLVGSESFTKRSIYIPQEFLSQHGLVIAPSGSGKTFGLAVPWTVRLHQLGIGVFVLDVKGNLYDKLIRFIHPDDILRFSFQPGSLRWNPLAEISKTRLDLDIQTIAEAIYQDSPADASGDGRFFMEKDLRILKALLRLNFYTKGKGSTLAGLYETLLTEERLQNEIALLPGALRDSIESELSFTWTGKRRSYAEEIAGVLNKLEPFKQEPFRTHLSAHEISVRDLEDGKVFLFEAPLDLETPATVMASLVLRLMQSYFYSRFNMPNRRQIVCILDEFARIKMKAEEFVSVAREAGAGVVMFLQDVTQLEEKKRDAIANNCATVISLYGVGEKSAEWLEKRFGERFRLQESTSYGTNSGSNSSLGTTGISGGYSRGSNESTSHQESWVPTVRRTEIMYPLKNQRSGFLHCRLLTDAPLCMDFSIDQNLQPLHFSTNKKPLAKFASWRLVAKAYGALVLLTALAGLIF